jgi:superfamily I DNA and RNA helicase
MKWMVPERLLDENQLDILRKCGGIQGHNQWIQGFAGSGKTALVVHAAQRLLAVDENTSVCIVTFTHALKCST